MENKKVKLYEILKELGTVKSKLSKELDIVDEHQECYDSYEMREYHDECYSELCGEVYSAIKKICELEGIDFEEFNAEIDKEADERIQRLFDEGHFPDFDDDEEQEGEV